MQRWLLLDCNYLAWRSFHSTGHIDFGGGNGTLYGFLRDVIAFQKQHNTSHVAFCFDYGKPIRRKLLPDYKVTRRIEKEELPPSDRKRYLDFRRRVRALHREILPAMGFVNVFAQKGYEADDILAVLTRGPLRKADCILVSSDHDVYQLLGKRVSCWVPGMGSITLQKFREVWRIAPTAWISVKSIAGCRSDDIPGVVGIGEVLAARYLRGEMQPESLRYKQIEASSDRIAFNRQLVSLPYPGCGPFEIREDTVTWKKWRRVLRLLSLPDDLIPDRDWGRFRRGNK